MVIEMILTDNSKSTFKSFVKLIIYYLLDLLD